MRSLVGILSACIERTPEGQKQLYGVHLYEYAVHCDTEGIQLSQKTMTGFSLLSDWTLRQRSGERLQCRVSPGEGWRDDRIGTWNCSTCVLEASAYVESLGHADS